MLSYPQEVPAGDDPRDSDSVWSLVPTANTLAKKSVPGVSL